MPIPLASGLPTNIISRREVQALADFEELMGGAWNVHDGGPELKKGAKKGYATGQAYKMLRKMLKDQCKDEYLTQCSLQKVKAHDGTIEWVDEQSRERFMSQGSSCLIWNNAMLSLPPPAPKRKPMKDEGGGGMLDMLAGGMTAVAEFDEAVGDQEAVTDVKEMVGEAATEVKDAVGTAVGVAAEGVGAAAAEAVDRLQEKREQLQELLNGGILSQVEFDAEMEKLC